jgi:DnaJ-class molecular chaperone
VTQAYKVLCDDKKRKQYDTTGAFDESTQSYDDAYTYWRTVFPKINAAQIDSFRRTYIGVRRRANSLSRDSLLHLASQFARAHKERTQTTLTPHTTTAILAITCRATSSAATCCS